MSRFDEELPRYAEALTRVREMHPTAATALEKQYGAPPTKNPRNEGEDKHWGLLHLRNPDAQDQDDQRRGVVTGIDVARRKPLWIVIARPRPGNPGV